MTDTRQFSEQVRHFLHLHGARATLPRIKIFKALAHYREVFFAADDITQNLQQKNEIMAPSTVHKTLQQLCLMGLLANERTSSGALLYKKTGLFQNFQAGISG